MRIGECGVIICNSEISHPGRLRFTIAHELGHWFLHPTQTQDFLLTEENVARHKASPMEAEANAFAGTLLMPRRWFGWHVSGAEPLIANVIKAANAFDVSVMAATKRFLDLTLIPSIAVFSDGEQVKWVWKSSGVSKLWLPPGSEISPDCTAYQCTDSPETASRIGAIQNTGECWFPDDYRAERIVVTEQSCRLYKDIVLTLMKFNVTG
ncbi:MAG: ImmA/IrrE family metallo-endopeptidase [Fimbriimonadaceae bacterium]